MVTLGSHAYVDRLVLGEQTRSTLEYDHFKFGEDLNKMTMRPVGSSLHIEFTQFVRMVSMAVNSTNRQVELTFADPHGLTAGDTITLGTFDAATTDVVIGAPTSEIVGSHIIAIPGTNPNTTLTFNIVTQPAANQTTTHTANPLPLVRIDRLAQINTVDPNILVRKNTLNFASPYTNTERF